MKIAEFEPGMILVAREKCDGGEVRDRYFIRAADDGRVQERFGSQFVAAHYLGFIQGIPEGEVTLEPGEVYRPRVIQLRQDKPCADPGCTDGRYPGFILPESKFYDIFMGYYGVEGIQDFIKKVTG